MRKTVIEGIIVPIVTPMDERGEVDLAQLEKQCDRMVECGIDGIFAFGTNGEGYILSYEEKEAVLSTVISRVAGRVPVYAGTGAVSTAEAVRTSRMAERLGADVLSVITPSFAKASQDELYEYYRTVAGSTSLPVVLYNIPARTGNSLSPKTVARLAGIDNIVGAKDSSGDFSNILSYIQETGKVRDDFAILSGNDRLIIWTLIAGGKGGIAGCANVYPRTLASLYDLFKEGRQSEAIAVNESLSAFRSLFALGNPNTIVKKAVQLLGYEVGECRAPFNLLSEDAVARIRATLEADKARGLC